MENILTKIFEFNKNKKEFEKTVLDNSVKTWVVVFPVFELRSYDNYNSLIRMEKGFQSFTSKDDAKVFYKAITSSFELSGNKSLNKFVELYEEPNHTL